MALILHIETSTEVCSVALSRDGNVLFSKIENEGPSHAALIGPFIDEAMRVAENAGLKLDAVSVSSGPGSYTGLRIGVSAAKGVCYALQIPLIAIPTIDLIADMCIRKFELTDDSLIRPVLDARRMEVYTGLFGKDGSCLEKTNALVVKEDTFEKELSGNVVLFAGNGASKLRKFINSENARFVEDLSPLAEAMMPLAEKAYSDSCFVNVAYFEPFYLKEFIATVPRKNIISGR
jgi:tRNA threonylcarbamoyladenosine biosynthesis protein TsaB